MKELESPLKITPDVQLIAEINKEYTLKGSMQKMHDGRKLYVVNPINMTVEEVNITSFVKIGLDGKPISEHRASFNPNVIYIWSLNKYNALRKVQNDLERFIKRRKEIETHKMKLSGLMVE